MKFEYVNLKNYSSKVLKKLILKVADSECDTLCLPPNTTFLANKLLKGKLSLGTVIGFPTKREIQMIQKRPNLGLYLGKYSKNQIQEIRFIAQTQQVDELTLMFPNYWYSKKYLVRTKDFLSGVKSKFQKPVRVNIELGTVFGDKLNLWTINNILEEAKVDYIQTSFGFLPQQFNQLMAKLGLLQTITKLPIHVTGVFTKDQIKELADIHIQRIITDVLIVKE